MRGSVITLLLCLCACASNGAVPADRCALPPGLDKEIAKQFPDRHIEHMTDLSDYDRKLFRKDHGERCPGLVKVNFYGDGRPTWAVVLTAGEHPKRKVTLLVARQAADGWELRTLEESDGAPVVWREGPGKYEGLYEGQTIQATRPVVVLCEYGSTEVVYAWMGDRVDKVWLSD